jgi:WD40 repeat protein
VGADVYSFGGTIWGGLGGETPFRAASTSLDELVRFKLRTPPTLITDLRPEIPASVAEVLRRATSVSPHDRLISVEELVLAWRQAVPAGTPQTAHPGDAAAADGSLRVTPPPHGGGVGDTFVSLDAARPNPYKGLRAFDEADAADFHGRDELVEGLLAHLREAPFLAVVGPSGSGKSSVVRAGVVPALRARGAFVVTMVPGRHPYDELETGLLRIASSDISSLMRQLRDDERGMSRAVRRVLPRPDDELVLVIDQFEELFTLTDEPLRGEFLRSLIAALSADRRVVRVIVTVRADFYDRPLAVPGIGELVRDNTVAVTPLTPPELEEAIIEPATRSGVTMDPAVVGELVAEVRRAPGSLPLLQYALTELFERRQDGRITTDAYQAIGGVTGALSRRAEQIYQDQAPDEREATRRLFLRLITLGEGVEDTRRRVRRSELPSVPPPVIEAFGDARLLSFDRDQASREPTVEVAHEALIREWPRLRAWVAEDREGLRALRHLTAAAESWGAGGRDTGDLYRGTRLEAAVEYADARQADLTGLERDFLDASLAAREAEQDAERRLVRRLRRSLAVIGAVLVVALLAGALAFQQRQRAGEQADVATAARDAAVTRRLVSDAPQVAETNRRVGLLLAAEAYRRDPSHQTLGALQRVLTSTDSFLGYMRTGEEFMDLAWLPGGQLALLGPSGIDVLDVDTAETRHLADIGSPLFLTASSDGSRLAVVSADQTARVFDAASGEEVGSVRRHDSPVTAAALLDDGALLTGTRAGDVTGWPPEGDQPARVIPAHPEHDAAELAHLAGDAAVARPHEPQSFLVGVAAVAGSADGRHVASVGSGFARVWDRMTGELVAEEVFTRPEGEDRVLTVPLAAGFSPSDDSLVHLASAVHRQTLDIGSGTVIEEEPFQDREGATFDFTGGRDTTFRFVGDRGLVASADGRVLVIDLTGDRPPLSVDTEMSGALRATVDPEGERVAVASEEGLGVWSLDGSGLISRSVPRQGRTQVWVADDGRLLIGGNLLWDLRGEESRTAELDTDFAWLVGPRLATYDYESRLLDLYPSDTPDGTAVRFGPTAAYTALPAEDQGWLLVGAGSPSDPPVVRVYDLATGDEVATLDDLVPLAAEDDVVRSIGLAPDGSRLAAATSSGAAMLWDTASWQPIEPPLSTGAGAVVQTKFTPDGRYLVTLDADGAITLRDPETLQPVHQLLGQLEANEGISEGPFFTDDARYMVTKADGRPRLWDLTERVQIGGAFPNDEGAAPGVADNARWLATLLGAAATVWDLDVDRWFEIACRAAGRNLSLEEWDQYGPADDYAATCPQWPAASDVESATSEAKE